MFSTRQDLQATIEELQSANEELQANNEELQSTNEELETVNVELQKKNDALHQANDDINNLFGATDIGTLILDRELRIQRYTPSATHCFRLIASDIGRPVTDIATDLVVDDLSERLREVLDALKKQILEVRDRGGKWYSLHMLPYRTSENAIGGAVLTFAEITAQKKAQLEAKEAKTFAEAILATIREPLLVLDGDLQVISANHSFYSFFRVKPEQTTGAPVFELGNGQWDIPELRHLLTRIIPENNEFKDFHVNHDFPGIGQRVMLLNARRMTVEGRPSMILLAFEDITDRSGLEPEA